LNSITNLTLVISFLVLPNLIYSSIYDYFPKKLEPSSSNYGITGLLQMPTARSMKEGSMKIGASFSYPYEYTYITATPFSWLEASYKYTEVKNELYGPAQYSGNQTLKDKGFDFKLKLKKEGYYIPEIALGWNDLAGTGRFSGEYLVASKKIKDFDLTLGLGWGALGQDENLRNPFIAFNEKFSNRQIDNKIEGGSFNYKSWFSGKEVSLYSGLEYYSWKNGLVFKIEYDTTNPDQGYSGPKIDVHSRFNFGINRPLNENLTMGFSFERGSEWRFSFDLKSDYGTKPLVKKNDPPKNVISLNADQKEAVIKNREIFYRSLNRSLREESILIQSANLTSKEAKVTIAQNRFKSFPRAIGRTVRIVSALSPDSIETIEVSHMNGDNEVYSVKVLRNKFDELSKGSSNSKQLYLSSEVISKQPNSYITDEFLPSVNFPEIFFNMAPSLRHQIGGPESFYLGQLWLKLNTKVKFARGLTLHNVIGIDIYNTFDEFANPSYSTIPRVRSDIQEYLSEGKNNIARLKLDYIWSPAKDIFARFDIGYLEEMFGGVGGEVYYRPFNNNFSTGLQIHRVKQRDYKQRFDFKDYETTTGHIGFYYDFSGGIQAQMLVGKYLAGDKGATLDLSRRFKNGFTLGVFATKTNLSSEEFGEGSFDKGFYFSIPIDSFFTDFRRGDISFGLHPLTKDGGAILNNVNSLYALYGDTHLSSIKRDWKTINE